MLYDRKIRKEIENYLYEKEAIIILGTRQVGKTSLLNLIMENLQGKERVFYFDLESPRGLRILNEGVESFLAYLKALGANLLERNFVFIDEIQYMNDPSRFLKLLVDHHSSSVKLFATGSSSLDIKLKFKDSLVGRKIVFYLYPLSFAEFLLFKEEWRLADLLGNSLFSQEYKEARFFEDEYKRYFKEFLIFGGYPGVALLDSVEKKTRLLGEIVSSYLYKDVKALFAIEDITKFNNLIQLLASQTGNLLNENSISKMVGLSRVTVSRYISILEETFILYLLRPFFKNKTKEITKSRKIYLIDNGLRNYILGNLSPDNIETGKMLENIVLTGLLKRKTDIDQIYFWRTQSKSEVDFILKRGQELLPIEVKKTGKTTNALYSFMKEYALKNGFVVHSNGFGSNKDIEMLPAWWVV